MSGLAIPTRREVGRSNATGPPSSVPPVSHTPALPPGTLSIVFISIAPAV